MVSGLYLQHLKRHRVAHQPQQRLERAVADRVVAQVNAANRLAVLYLVPDAVVPLPAMGMLRLACSPTSEVGNAPCCCLIHQRLVGWR